jgi:hypothetical protein
MYTTKLDKSRPGFEQREREADQIAQAIERNAPLSANIHLAEVRQCTPSPPFCLCCVCVRLHVPLAVSCTRRRTDAPCGSVFMYANYAFRRCLYVHVEAE